jgi:hypothetical protein
MLLLLQTKFKYLRKRQQQKKTNWAVTAEAAALGESFFWSFFRLIN